ncbi:alkaline phosphatase family protein [Aestuariispira insulae]|uniref:PhoD-like phosphatase n=1 Tax=Aestuariispira insulae TaxID=1461337 RepID=A0A3D9HGT5_9PROT|nr:alkaline phosphatase family protein [Aestuariispira insulae]RED48615.1 hypothetical protein DFP90_107119 [Aestuariispira insulae]
MPENTSLPWLLAGPILRKIEPSRISFWLASSAGGPLRLTLQPEDAQQQVLEINSDDSGHSRLLQAGEKLFFHLISLDLSSPLPVDRRVDYVLERQQDGKGWIDITSEAPYLLYPNQNRMTFRVPGEIKSILHGSCRKPHHNSGDGLVAADNLMADLMKPGPREDPLPPHRPSLLLMTGDQIYADDVAGPMLIAIHDVIARLGLFTERFDLAEHEDYRTSDKIHHHDYSYYRRSEMLPKLQGEDDLAKVFFGGIRKPVFTSDTSDNHLITLAEHLVMYLMVWSPVPWEFADTSPPDGLSPKQSARYRRERQIIRSFKEGLPQVQRLLAHLPTAMIFDDHDVSDDWNLNREWEEEVYGHPFSKRMVGNALAAYLTCQGWGNAPTEFPTTLMEHLDQTLKQPGSSEHDEFTDELLRFEGWEYIWETSPPLTVIDTRTRRWRSESSRVKPAGLLDWEAITDLQQMLKGKEAVILVSSAPIFGVKLIENIQAFFTWLGKPLMVDAENWMAHPGTAHAILNIFMHKRTPRNFTILSGDVHYSFVYDVELRRHNRGSDIWQICSSGLRNEFPKTLLDRLDILNRWLYSPSSPLNWFTKRRRMRVVPRRPEGLEDGRRLLNGAGIGLVEFDDQGRPERIRQLLTNGEFRGFERMEHHHQYR